MANAVDRVAKGTVDALAAQFAKRSVASQAARTTYYANALVGVGETGYYCKGDDTQSWLFAGLVRGEGGNPVLPVGAAGDDALHLDVHRPPLFEFAVAGVAVTDIGKAVYASEDKTGVLSSASLVYANVVGQVVDVVAAGIALVAGAYDGVAANVRLAAAKTLAATGHQTLSRYDLGKTIVLTNTEALTVFLPPVAGCPPGSWLRFVKKSTAAAAATLDANGSEEIDSAATLATLDAEHDCVTLVSDGTQWHVESRDIT